MAVAAGLGCAAVDTASMALSASLYGGTPFLGTAMGIQVRLGTCKAQNKSGEAHGRQLTLCTETLRPLGEAVSHTLGVS